MCGSRRTLARPAIPRTAVELIVIVFLESSKGAVHDSEMEI
jgi:hypothetical protein